jgi:hypothetical protein
MTSLLPLLGPLRVNASYRLLATAPFKLAHGNTIEMAPQQYLDLAMPFGHQGGPKADQAKIDKLAKMPKWESNPMFSVKENANGELQVALHDGRHRAAAAKQRGDRTLKVDIVRGRKFAREHPEISDSDLAVLVVKNGLLPEL